MHVEGVYNYFDSVLPQQKFEATDGPVLQLIFIWQAKDWTELTRLIYFNQIIHLIKWEKWKSFNI